MTRFAYTAVDHNPASLMPHLPLMLEYRKHNVEVNGLLDTGSAVNLLPYSVGLALGAVWVEQTVNVPLTGSLRRFEARCLVVRASHPQLSPVQLVFAWTQAEDIPVVFGQVNFFMEFDVYFFRSQNAFEVRKK